MTASPLRRTLYTALESFAPVFEANPDLKIVALPDLQEISDVACDTGSEPSVLKEEFKSGVDLDLVHEGWNNKVCLGVTEMRSPFPVTHELTRISVAKRSLCANQPSDQRACPRSPPMAESPPGEGDRHGHTRWLPTLLYGRLGR